MCSVGMLGSDLNRTTESSYSSVFVPPSFSWSIKIRNELLDFYVFITVLKMMELCLSWMFICWFKSQEAFRCKRHEYVWVVQVLFLLSFLPGGWLLLRELHLPSKTLCEIGGGEGRCVLLFCIVRKEVFLIMNLRKYQYFFLSVCFSLFFLSSSSHPT